MESVDVSVVVAVKNEQLYIRYALESILTQEGLSFEVVLIDDGSDDDTWAIVSEFSKTNENISIHRNPRKGKCSAFNYGVDIARGRYICLFAGDDLMPDRSLAARFEMVKSFPDSVPVVGLCKLTTMSDIKRLNGHLIPRASGRGALSGVSPLMNQLALAKIFPVPESLPNEDTWMELAVLYISGMCVIHSDIVGCNWRLHSGNSINMLVEYSEYNRRISARLRAYPLFYELNNSDLNELGRRELPEKVECETRRLSGDILGVLRSKVGFVDKLRALSITNKGLYEIRRRLYGLLSGW